MIPLPPRCRYLTEGSDSNDGESVGRNISVSNDLSTKISTSRERTAQITEMSIGPEMVNDNLEMMCDDEDSSALEPKEMHVTDGRLQLPNTSSRYDPDSGLFSLPSPPKLTPTKASFKN